MMRPFRTIGIVAFCLLSTAVVVCLSYRAPQDGFYFDPAPVDQDIVDGEGVRMRCDVSNRNSIAFYWTMNGVKLANVSRRFQEGSDLRFLWINRALDNGTFHCIATNVTTGIALQSVSARLNILWIDKTAEVEVVKPVDSSNKAMEEEEEDAEEGAEIQLRCNVGGNEEPQIEWFKNKIRLTNSERIKIQKGRNLRIASASAVDNGVYSCRGRNSAGLTTSSSDFVLNILGSNNARLNVESFKTFVLVHKGETAFLNCQYPEEETTSVHWMQNKLRVEPSEKFTVHENGTLEIKDAQRDDEGVYKCTASFQRGGSQTFAVEFKTAFLDEFTSRHLIPRATPDPHVVPRGGRYSARCYPPQGLPQPTVRWFDPSGNEIEVDRRKPLYFTEGVISFANIQPTSAGKYKCVAENSVGQVQQYVDLAVSEPSKIARTPLSTRVKEGSSATFDCKVTGSKYPITKIGWMFEERPIEANERFKIDEQNGVLTVEGVEASDEGNYVCYTKTIGQPTVTSGNAFLYVEKRLKFDPMPADSYVELGASDQVECKASGMTRPTITWYREGRQPLQKGVTSSEEEGRLLFEKVQVSDAGRYSCYASTEAETINATVNVFTTVKPRLKIKPVNTTVVEGSSVVMHCVAIGEPTPQVDWYKNTWSTELDKNRFKIFSNGTLILSTAFSEDSGLYGCVASSPSATVREEAYLSVITKDESDAKGLNPQGKFSTYVIAVIGLAIAVGLLLIVVVVVKRRKVARGKENDPEKGVVHGGSSCQKSPEQMSLMHGRDASCKAGSLTEGSDSRSHASGDSRSQHSHASNTLKSCQSLRSFDKFSFSRSHLHNIGRLGTGDFGEVVLAKAYNILPGCVESIVMVKVLTATEEQYRKEFKENMELFSKTVHPYFSKLLAICKDDEPFLAVFEYTDWGILKQLLEASRGGNADAAMGMGSLVPSNEQRLNVCKQVAQALDYLHNQVKLCHKDLAARNVLVSSNFSVKVSNLGLTHDLYVNEYYTYQQQNLPIRWMSPEALLEDKRNSPTSDIWSFGVFMWEVHTLASLPLSDKTNEMVIKGLRMGDVELPYPPRCPPEIWSLITKCRNFDPGSRPGFADMILALNSMPPDVVV